MKIDAVSATTRVVPLDAGPVEAWDALATRTGAPPFARPAWVRAWAEMADAQVDVAIVEGVSGLVAAYPVVRRGSSGWATASDWHTPRADVVGDARELAAHLVSGSHRVTADFAAGETAAAFADALIDAGFRIRRRTRLRSPIVDLSLGWEAYREAISTKKWREIRRRRRRLEELGTVTFDTFDGSDDLDALLDEGFSVEGSGWKDASGTSIRSDVAVAEFYRRVSHWAAGEGMLRLHFLRLDGRAIAFDLALVSGETEWLVKTGFDPDLYSASPGSLLRAEVLERAFAAGLSRYEFLGGDDAWKLEWTTDTVAIDRIDGYAPGIRGRILEGADRLKRRLSVSMGRGTA